MVWCWWDGPLGAERREAAGLMESCVSAGPLLHVQSHDKGTPTLGIRWGRRRPGGQVWGPGVGRLWMERKVDFSASGQRLGAGRGSPA